MSVFEHARTSIFNTGQHPLRHSADEIAYLSDAVPGVASLGGALDWLFAVLYPRSRESVETPGDLPLVGNALLDYRVVRNDGDGKAASYRWEQREGEASASWHKIYDMDWSEDSILSAFLLKTQDVYVYRHGYDDIDASGVPLAGIDAGQHIFGGASANSHLTFWANSGDGTGPATGYIQMGDQVRPRVTASIALGTTAERWTNVWSALLTAGTMTLAAGLITDGSGVISFDNENLTTTGSMTAGSFGSSGAVTGASLVASSGGNTTTITPGSIVSSTGQVSFDDENLVTTGAVTAGSFVRGSLTIGAASITDTSGSISFADENLSTTGTLSAGAITGTQLNVDNLRLDGNTLSVTQVDGTLIVAANGVGIVDIQSAMTTIGQTVTGVLSVTGQVNADNLRLDGNTISATNANGDLVLSPAGSGALYSSAKFLPSADGTLDIGGVAARFQSLYLTTSISDGTTAISSATLQSLRDINVGVASGMSIFWNGSKWVASIPDTEVDHGTITGLADDDHTQYALLAGRSGGQSLFGGTGASEALALSSTAHGTKGAITTDSVIRPTTNNAVDLGATATRWKDAYIQGQLFGARLENATTAGRPSASAGTKGRVLYDTDLEDVFVDRGGTWKKLSLEKYVLQDTTGWDGVATSVVYTVSAEVSDARECVWTIYSNSATFAEISGASITKSQTQVTVTVGAALPAGTYTIVGIG